LSVRTTSFGTANIVLISGQHATLSQFMIAEQSIHGPMAQFMAKPIRDRRSIHITNKKALRFEVLFSYINQLF
jgi:hypothetical protein